MTFLATSASHVTKSYALCEAAHAEAGAAGTTIERTRIASASIPKRLAAGSGYASAEIPFGWSTRDRALHRGFDKQRRADGTFERHYTCDPKDARHRADRNQSGFIVGF